MNKALLQYEMKKRDITICKMCSRLGVSRSAFYRKCNGITEFTQSEIQKIVDIFELETPVGIFFEDKCLKGHEAEAN